MILTLLGISALAIFDAWFTRRQFKIFGPKVELNPSIKWLVKHVGETQGILVGVLAPTVSGVALCYAESLEKTALIWLGMRLTLALHQIKFLSDFQKKIKLLQNTRDS